MTDHPRCGATLGPNEACGEIASWKRDDGLYLCQMHNDWDLESGETDMPRHGVWEDFKEQEESQVEVEPESEEQRQVVGPNIGLEDLEGRLIQLTNRWPMGLLVKICFIGLTRYLEAHDRWLRLEDRGGHRAPLWLSEREATKLVSMLAGQRGAEARLVRQEIGRLFDLSTQKEEG